MGGEKRITRRFSTINPSEIGSRRLDGQSYSASGALLEFETSGETKS